jgi:hypothetical protein
MAITWTENAESRAMLAPSVQMQQNLATFGASDYATGGYAVYPSAFGLSAIRALIPVAFSATAAGTPGGYVWQAVKPSTAGPAATNPWYLRAMRQTAATGPLVETASNTDFSGGTADFLAIGY